LRLDLQIALATFKTVFLRQGIAAKGAATMPRFDTYVLEKQKSSSDRKQQL